MFNNSVDNNGLHQQYNVEELHNANRMAVIANMVGQGGVPPGLGSDTSAAANIAAANIANLAMRLGVTQVKYMYYETVYIQKSTSKLHQ